jgi:hypothetical protein
MDNPEKLATQGTQDEDKQNKNTTQYVFDTTIRKQNINNVNRTWVLLQITGGTDELNTVLCGNSNGHHNTEPRT